MAKGDWLDPEWGTDGELSNTTSKTVSNTKYGLATGADMMGMTKAMLEDYYTPRRPDDGVTGVRPAIVIHSEEMELGEVPDPVLKDMIDLLDGAKLTSKVLVVYAAPAGGSSSMFPKPKCKDDTASKIRFPRFYKFSTNNDASANRAAWLGKPCNVEITDKITHAFGVFHGMAETELESMSAKEEFLYRAGFASVVSSGDCDGKGLSQIFDTIGVAIDTAANMAQFTEEGPTRAAATVAGLGYHTSVPMVDFGERGGGRIKRNKEPKARDLKTFEGVRGRDGKKRRHKLETNTFNAYQGLLIAASQDGITDPLLRCASGHRSVPHQQKIWDKNRPKYSSDRECRKFVAKPGSSRHHSGRAVDFYLGYPIKKANISKMKSTPAFLWLKENAEFFGFYNYEAEPWHWEFNPDNREMRLGSLIDLHEAAKKA